jgi:hypothetical protein
MRRGLSRPRSSQNGDRRSAMAAAVRTCLLDRAFRNDRLRRDAANSPRSREPGSGRRHRRPPARDSRYCLQLVFRLDHVGGGHMLAVTGRHTSTKGTPTEQVGPCREGRRTSGSLLTPCWREPDSKSRFPVATVAWQSRWEVRICGAAEPVRLQKLDGRLYKSRAHRERGRPLRAMNSGKASSALAPRTTCVV